MRVGFFIVLACCAGAAAVAQTRPPETPTEPEVPLGLAHVCATADLTFDTYSEIKLPATTAFHDGGPLKGDLQAAWDINAPVASDDNRGAEFMSTASVTLTKAAPCAEIPVRMVVDEPGNATSARASDGRVWDIVDVIDYPLGLRPPIEIGRLLDDIAIRATLLTDVADPFVVSRSHLDEAGSAAKCLADARALAAKIGAGVGRQTSMRVVLGQTGVPDLSYGCDDRKPTILANWDHARPSATILDVLSNAGAVLTGAAMDDVKSLISRCVKDALQPDADELANGEFDGVRVECQAFERDGGGGHATIFRRLGGYPSVTAPSAAELEALDSASQHQRAAEAAKAGEVMAFAAWFLDPGVPANVKSALILVARMEALGARCPTWKPVRRSIPAILASVDVSALDIQPGGRYWSTYARLSAAMRDGTNGESVDDACRAARDYYN